MGRESFLDFVAVGAVEPRPLDEIAREQSYRGNRIGRCRWVEAEENQHRDCAKKTICILIFTYR